MLGELGRGAGGNGFGTSMAVNQDCARQLGVKEQRRVAKTIQRRLFQVANLHLHLVLALVQLCLVLKEFSLECVICQTLLWKEEHP